MYNDYLVTSGFASGQVSQPTCGLHLNSTYQNPIAYYQNQCWFPLDFPVDVQTVSCIASYYNRICVMYLYQDVQTIACQNAIDVPASWQNISSSPVFHCPMYMDEVFILLHH